jgi:hypothetical protein
MDDVDAAGELLHELIGERAGAVRRVVVDDHDPRLGLRHERPHQLRQVLAFVVGRDDDQDHRPSGY